VKTGGFLLEFMASKYDKKYCTLLTQMMKEGASVAEVAAKIGVHRVTLYKWADKEPAFKAAMELGKEFSEAWWMTVARHNLTNKQFNATLWYMNMKNRFGWRDEKPVEEKQEAPKIIGLPSVNIEAV
jgi:hypothetical protein